MMVGVGSQFGSPASLAPLTFNNTNGSLKLATGPGHGGPGSDRRQCARMSATRALLEEAEIEATLAAHCEWVAAGQPGAVTDDEAMPELLGSQ
jgi:hypothetical protein